MPIRIPTMPPDALERLAAWCGTPLPEGCVAFVSRPDGAEPEQNVVAVADNQTKVVRFGPVAETVVRSGATDGFPPSAILLAEDSFDNCIYNEYIEPTTGRVRF